MRAKPAYSHEKVLSITTQRTSELKQKIYNDSRSACYAESVWQFIEFIQNNNRVGQTIKAI